MVTITTPTISKNWLPSNNPIVYTFATTNTAPRLSYIINVTLNGSNTIKLKYPVYDRNSLSVDLKSIVCDFLKDTFVNDSTGFSTQADEVCSIDLVVDEEYYNTNTNQMVVDANVATANPVFVWRAAAQFQDSRDLVNFYKKVDITAGTYPYYGKFLGVANYCNDVADETYLTSPYFYLPQAITKQCYKVSQTTKRTIQFFTQSTWTGNSSRTRFLQCLVYNEKMQLTKQLEKDIHAGLYTYDEKIGCIPVGINELNTIGWDYSMLHAGTTTLIDPSEDKYYFLTVTTTYGIINQHRVTITQPTQEGFKWVGFEIVPCDQYKVYNILYKTTEGGWWQIRADKKHYNSTDVKSNLKYNTWGRTSQQTLPNDARFKQTTHTEANGSIILNTDWIDNQGIIKEIEDMIISPSIYLVSEDLNPVYIPVLLKDSTFDIKDKGQDKLFNYTFEFEEAYKKTTLR